MKTSRIAIALQVLLLVACFFSNYKHEAQMIVVMEMIIFSFVGICMVIGSNK